MERQLYEMHRAEYCANTTCDILYNFDCKLVSSSFPDFFSVNLNMKRFVANMRHCPRKLPKHVPIERPSSLPEQFNDQLCKLIQPIEQKCGPILKMVDSFHSKSVNFPELTTLEEFSSRECFYARLLKWHGVLSKYSLNMEMLQDIKKASENISAKLEQMLIDYVKHNPLSDEDRQKMVEEIRMIYEEKTLFLRSMVMLAEDALAIIHGNTVLDAEYDPWELSDEINSPRLSMLLGEEEDPPVLAEPEMPAPQPSIDLSEHTSNEAAPLPAEAKEFVPSQEEPKPLSRKERRRQAEAAAAAMENDAKEAPVERQGRASRRPAAPPLPPAAEASHSSEQSQLFSISSLEEILNTDKTRKIVQALITAGCIFARQKGSHMMFYWRGRLVVVPDHPTIPLGTRMNIVTMLTKPQSAHKRQSAKR